MPTYLSKETRPFVRHVRAKIFMKARKEWSDRNVAHVQVDGKKIVI
jgi:hypothetical protein